MRRSSFSLAQGILLATLLVATTVMAQAPDANAAAQQAAAMTGGRVLDVQVGYAGGRNVYIVRVLLGDGRVKLVRIDGSAGMAAPGGGRR
ncbi:MAG: PepSY domain-containing protein [Gammaproteobacteria bacterium]